MQLQDTRTAAEATRQGMHTPPPAAGTAGGVAAGARAVPAEGAPSTGGGTGGAGAGLAIPFARGFDAVGMGLTVLVHLPPDSVGERPQEALATGPAAASPGLGPMWSTDADGPQTLPWLVGVLKLLALAVGLGAAYLSGQFLFNGPADPLAPVRPASVLQPEAPR